MPTAKIAEHAHFTTIIVTLCMTLLAWSQGVSAGSYNNEILNKSDVISYRRGSIQEYRDYRVDLVSWGGNPDATPVGLQRYKVEVSKARIAGVKTCAKVGTRTEFAEFMDYAPISFMDSRCIKLDGTPYIVPDALNKTYKGHPAYWFCTNSDKFLEYLHQRMTRAFSANVAGFTLDDPQGPVGLTLFHDGCYCSSCSAKFKMYLMVKYTPRQLAGMGISNIAHFDLKAFHAAYANTPFQRRPLFNDYLQFQLHSIGNYIRNIMEFARQKNGPSTLRAVNDPPYSRFAPFFANSLDYFSSETIMNASLETVMESKAMFAFKIASALGKPVAIMGTGEDNLFLKTHDAAGMLRAWISEAYANGHYFMAPVEYWTYSKVAGSGSYKPTDRTPYSSLYGFIKENRELFDGYTNLAKLVIVISYADLVGQPLVQEKLIGAAEKLNVPFDILLSCRDTADMRLSNDALKNYSHIMFSKTASIDNLPQEFLQSGSVTGFKIIRNIEDAKPLQINVPGQSNVSVFLRNKSGRLVVHVLNKDYSLARDACAPKKNVSLRIPKMYLDGTTKNITYYAPPALSPKSGVHNRSLGNAERLTLRGVMQGDQLVVTIPNLDLWGIIEIRFGTTDPRWSTNFLPMVGS